MKILFVCSGNTCRSPMAEVYLRHRRPAWTVRSAGVSATSGSPAAENARLVVAERGLDLSEHRARPLDPAEPGLYDRVYVMAREHLVPGAELLSSLRDEKVDVEDPFGGDLQDYRRAFEEICFYLEGLADEG